jgi:hypothetical protein
MSQQLPMQQHAREPGSVESAARLTVLGRLAAVLVPESRNPLTTIFLHTDILEMACSPHSSVGSSSLCRRRKPGNVVWACMWRMRLS